MNKLKYILFIFLFSFLFASNSNATSGTCSSHSGVNCSAGPDNDDSVICYDGWRESSENYYNTNICFQCTHPSSYHSGCKDEYDLGKVTVESGKYGGLMSSQAMGMIEGCKKEIKVYNDLMEQYQSCTSKIPTIYYDLTPSIPTVPEKTNQSGIETNPKLFEKILDQRGAKNYTELEPFNLDDIKIINTKINTLIKLDEWCRENQNAPQYNRHTNSCECSNTTYFNQSSQSCEFCPLNSALNIEKTGCSCKTGYVPNNEKTFCVSKDQWCKNNVKNSFYDTSSKNCACPSEYLYDEQTEACELVAVEKKTANTQKENNEEQPEVKKEVKKPEQNNTPKTIPIISVPQIPNKNSEALNLSSESGTTTETIEEISTNTIATGTENEQVREQKNEKMSFVQKIKTTAGNAVKNISNFVKNIFNKLKF